MIPDEIRAKLPHLEALLAEGHHIDPALRVVGVPRAVFETILRAGETGEGDEDEVTWGKQLLRAIAEGEINVARAWLRHTGREWKAAEAWLARRFPVRYGAEAGGEAEPVKLQLNIVTGEETRGRKARKTRDS
jgi:hypothetical protein